MIIEQDIHKPSYLEVSERMLKEVNNLSIMLEERLMYMSSFEQNIDRYFTEELTDLKVKIESTQQEESKGSRAAYEEKLQILLSQTKSILKVKDQVYEKLLKELEEMQIQILEYKDLDEAEREYAHEYFEAAIKPCLAPWIIGKLQPFPYLLEHELYMIAVLRTKRGNEKLGIIQCTSPVIPRIIEIPVGRKGVILVEELILEYSSEIFEYYKVESKSLMRITRKNLKHSMKENRYEREEGVKKSTSMGIVSRKCPVIKLEVSKSLSMDMILLLYQHIEVESKRIFYSKSPLELSFMQQIYSIIKQM